jgi:rhodanese-related sulfurtransferase
MKTVISGDDLQQRLVAKTPTIVFEALPEKYYRDGHIPGALQLNHQNVREAAARHAPDKSATIVVYCASATCRNSDIAATQLDALGYSDVRVYVGGKQDWSERQLPLARTDQAA